MLEFREDIAASGARLNALDDYLRAEVLAGDTFVCRNAVACKGSHRGQFYEGQLHHLGRHYDLWCEGRPLRVAVIALSYGHNPICVGLAERHAMVAIDSGMKRRFKADGELKARNPHMKGTTSALRALFGNGLGTDFDGEWINVDGRPQHIFECFALLNYLLCSAAPEDAPSPSRAPFDERAFKGAAKGRPTATMTQNCSQHLEAVLKILEPTVIIIQGFEVRKWLAPIFGETAKLFSAFEIARLHGRSVAVASFSNPAAYGELNWGTSDQTQYAREVVDPCLNAARQWILQPETAEFMS